MTQTALVTGGGTGIGRGIALALARRGYDMALVGRHPEPLEAVAGELRTLGVRAVALPADLTNPQQRADLLPRVRVALGPLDLLVNNAGTLPGGELASLTPDEIERAIALNLTAPIELTRLALPDLIARRGGIVCVASAVSLAPYPATSVYTATKAGLSGFASALRYETEPHGVRLLVVYPGATDTRMVAGMARAGGFAAFPMLAPEAAGERITAALRAGRRELRLGAGERALALAYRLAPWLVRPLLRSQHARFVRIMAAPRRDAPHAP